MKFTEAVLLAAKDKINVILLKKKSNGAQCQNGSAKWILVFEVIVPFIFVHTLFITLFFQFLPSVVIAAEQRQVNFEMVCYSCWLFVSEKSLPFSKKWKIPQIIGGTLWKFEKNLFQKSKCTHVSSINLKGKVSD